MSLASRIKDGDFSSIRQAIQQLGLKLGPGSAPTFSEVTLTGLTASRLVWSDSAKKLVSKDLIDLVAGTSNRITVADDGDGSITLSTPQDIHTGASPTFVALILSDIVESSKFKLTSIGGFAVKLTNKTGSNTVAGQLVKADTATDDAVILTAAGDDECFGVFLDSGVADGSEAWVVSGGIADVAMEDNTAATHGNWVQTSDAEAGYADATAGTPAAAPGHFEEIGHCIESVAAGGGGTHILARCVLHFN